MCADPERCSAPIKIISVTKTVFLCLLTNEPHALAYS